MPDKKTDATPTPGSPAAHKIEIDRLTLKTDRLEAKLKVATDELTFAKTNLVRIKNDYEARVVSTLKLDIQDLLGCDDVELSKITHGKKIEELETMLNTLILKTDRTPEGQFKPIRTGAATPPEYGKPENLTVGDIFGKTPDEIRKMGGNF